MSMILPLIIGAIGLCACLATFVIAWWPVKAEGSNHPTEDQNLWAYTQYPLGGGSVSPPRS
jgi:hypothetical protein